MSIDKRPKNGLDLAIMMLLELVPENKVLWEIAEAVAQNPLAYSHEAGNHCLFCYADDHGHSMEVYHTSDCPIVKAQTLCAQREVKR